MVVIRNGVFGASAFSIALGISATASAGDTGAVAARAFGDAPSGDVVALTTQEMAAMRGAGWLSGFLSTLIRTFDGKNTISYTINDEPTVTESSTGSLSASVSTSTTQIDLCASSCGLEPTDGSFTRTTSKTVTRTHSFSFSTRF